MAFLPYYGGGGTVTAMFAGRANSGYANRHVKSQPKEQESAPVDKSQGTGRHAQPSGIGQQQRPQRAAKLGGPEHRLAPPPDDVKPAICSRRAEAATQPAFYAVTLNRSLLI